MKKILRWNKKNEGKVFPSLQPRPTLSVKPAQAGFSFIPPPQICVFAQKNVYWGGRNPMQTVTIDIPEDIADLMVCDNKSDELRRNALLLYPFIKNETISHGRAAEILGISKWELIELYGSEGIPYIDQSWDEAEQDASNIMELLAKR